MISRVGERGGAARLTAERVARESYGRLVAFLTVRTGDVSGAEDALAEAFAAALKQWPTAGVPKNPGAWLLILARRRQTDELRRRRTAERVGESLKLTTEALESVASAPDGIPDRRLALMCACAHPVIDRNLRAPLILQTVLGLTAAQIASAYLMSPAAMGQRLVRAKARIREAGVPFRIPDQDELPGRLDAVLEAIYAAYAGGWSHADETGGSPLAEEAIWLGEAIVALLPDEPEAKGLLALMLYAEARRSARSDERGEYVPLDEQDTRQWDLAQIDKAEALLSQASTGGRSGHYQIEAAIQSAHVARRLCGVPNRRDILALYELLSALVPSPVVALNRTVARSHISGPVEALAELDRLAADGRIAEYQPYWAARGHLCAQAGRYEEANEALMVAIGLTIDPAVRRYLQSKLADISA